MSEDVYLLKQQRREDFISEESKLRYELEQFKAMHEDTLISLRDNRAALDVTGKDLVLLRQQLHEHAETITQLRTDLDESIRANEINASSFKAECPVDVWVESCGTRHIAMRIMCKRLADAIAQRDAAVKQVIEFREFIHRVRGAADGDMSFEYDDEEIVSLLGREAHELLTKADELSRVQKGEKGVNR